MKKSLRNLLIFLGIAVGLGVIYFAFFNNSGSGQTASTSSLSSTARSSATTPLNASGSATGSTLLALLGRVTGLTLNDDIFSNPTFQTLQDISITLPPVESRGRRNPFSPASTANTSISTPETTGINPE